MLFDVALHRKMLTENNSFNKLAVRGIGHHI